MTAMRPSINRCRIKNLTPKPPSFREKGAYQVSPLVGERLREGSGGGSRSLCTKSRSPPFLPRSGNVTAKVELEVKTVGIPFPLQGEREAIRECRRKLEMAARSEWPVLLLGESGSGK